MGKNKSGRYFIFPVRKLIYNEVPYIKYETFGRDYHGVYVGRPVLAKKTENGFSVKGQPIRVVNSEKISHSYYTRSNGLTTTAGEPCMPYFLKKLAGLDSSNYITVDKRTGAGAMYIDSYGFPIPLEDLSVIDMLKIAIRTIKPVLLSTDKNKARDQLGKLCIQLPDEPIADDCVDSSNGCANDDVVMPEME